MTLAWGCVWRRAPQNIAIARQLGVAVAAIADEPLAREVYLTGTGESLQRLCDIMLDRVTGTPREMAQPAARWSHGSSSLTWRSA